MPTPPFVSVINISTDYSSLALEVLAAIQKQRARGCFGKCWRPIELVHLLRNTSRSEERDLPFVRFPSLNTVFELSLKVAWNTRACRQVSGTDVTRIVTMSLKISAQRTLPALITYLRPVSHSRRSFSTSCFSTSYYAVRSRTSRPTEGSCLSVASPIHGLHWWFSSCSQYGLLRFVNRTRCVVAGPFSRTRQHDPGCERLLFGTRREL